MTDFLLTSFSLFVDFVVTAATAATVTSFALNYRCAKVVHTRNLMNIRMVLPFANGAFFFRFFKSPRYKLHSMSKEIKRSYFVRNLPKKNVLQIKLWYLRIWNMTTCALRASSSSDSCEFIVQRESVSSRSCCGCCKNCSTFTHWLAIFWLITVAATHIATREPFKYYLIWSFSMQELLTNSYYACAIQLRTAKHFMPWRHGSDAMPCQLRLLFPTDRKWNESYSVE